MNRTQAAKHDQRTPQTPVPQAALDYTSGTTQAQHMPAANSSPHRYLGNGYVQAIADQQQRLPCNVEVNEPDAGYEQEADRIADQVLRAQAQRPGSASPAVRRLSTESQRRTHTPPEIVTRVLASPGSPLGPALRRDMEQGFGRDFSGVRVHTGPAAERSAEALDAHAYTVGADIVLGARSSAEETRDGRKVLAHELAHVVQQAPADANSVPQGGRGGAALQRKPKRARSGSPAQPALEGKASAETASNKVPFAIHFDKPLTRSEFIDLAENTIYGRRTPGEWLGVPERFKASDSPVTVWVPAAEVEPQLRGKIAALPAHIQNFLTAYQGAAGSYADLQSVLNAGFLLEVAGVTEDELELSLLESPAAEPSDLVSWATQFLVRRQDQEESERKHAERERRREAEEKELEKWRKRFEKYPDLVLDKKIAELRAEPGSASAKDWLPRFARERARRRDVRRAQPVTRPETVEQAVGMLEEAWRDAEKEDVPDVKRALELVSRIDEWLQETASPDKYDRYFKDGMFRTVARQTVGMAKDQISNIRYKIRRQGENDWNRPTHLGGHWELGINSLKAAREYVEVMGARKSLEQTSLHGLQEASSRTTKYIAAGYGIVVAAPVVIGAGIKAAPFLTTHALTGAGFRVAPRLMLWAARHPVFSSAVGLGIAETAIQVGQDKYLDPFQLIFSLLHIYSARPGRGTPAPNVPHPEGEPDFIITGQPKVDPQTGKVTASVVEKASGRHFDAEVDITTGLGRITDQKTGQVVGAIDLNTADIGKQASAPAAPALAPATAPPTPAAPPPASIAPAPPLPAGQKGRQGTGAARGMLRDVDVLGPSVQLPASHTVFKNKPAVNDLLPVPQAQAATGVVNAPADVPSAQILGGPQHPSTVGQKNVAPVSMTTKPPPSNPPGNTGTSGPTARPTSAPAGASETGTSPVHPRVIRRGPPAQPPPQPEAAPPAPPPRVHPNVIRRTPAAEPPPVAEVVTPAPPPRAVNQNVIPQPSTETPPTPEVVPPAPARQVNQNVVPRRAPVPAAPEPEVAASAPRRPSSTRSSTEFDENEPTQVDLEPPSGHDVRGSAWRAGGGPSPAGVDVVSGEITSSPAAPTRTPTVSPPERLPAEAPPQPEIAHAREPAPSREPAARIPASKGSEPPKVDFRALPFPDKYKNLDDRVHKFGVEVIGWGSGAEKARTLTNTLRTNPAERRAYIEKLRREGVTPQMARAWADAYRQEHERAKWLTRTRGVPMNPTPESRITLMDLIAGLL